MMTVDELSERVNTVVAARNFGTPHVEDADRDEFAVALVLQGYDLSRAHRMAFKEIEDNDGALQMLARHRLAHSMPRAPDPKRTQKQCDNFNDRFPVGQRVVVRKDDGAGVETVTTSKAQVLSGHSAVIWLEGVSGCYQLDRVTAITQPRQ